MSNPDEKQSYKISMVAYREMPRRLNVPDLGLPKQSVKRVEGEPEEWVLDFMGMMMKANYPGEAVLSVRELMQIVRPALWPLQTRRRTNMSSL